MKNPYTGKPLGPIARAKVARYTTTLRRARRVLNRPHNPPARTASAHKVVRNAEHHIDVILRQEAKS